MIRKIDHVAVAVPSLERALSFWSDALGLEVGGIETVESEQVKVAFLDVGGSRIELLEATAEASPVARFVNKRGGGLHHLTLAVSDLPRLLTELEERGVKILGDGIRTGAGGRRVAFLHPSAAGGVLLELIERRDPPEVTEIAPGAAVLLYLRDPQEKLWGLLRRLDGHGVVLEGLDLGSFDTWLGQVERGEADVIGPSVLFVPMMRLEKILLDRSSGGLPSLADRFEERTGRSFREAFEDR
jgi:methylmalonyl-CoA/ethylmalonyl-CoA epimerase